MSVYWIASIVWHCPLTSYTYIAFYWIVSSRIRDTVFKNQVMQVIPRKKLTKNLYNIAIYWIVYTSISSIVSCLWINTCLCWVLTCSRDLSVLFSSYSNCLSYCNFAWLVLTVIVKILEGFYLNLMNRSDIFDSDMIVIYITYFIKQFLQPCYSM